MCGQRCLFLKVKYAIVNAGMKEKFIKIYTNLPLGLRGDIILVLPDLGPITWNVAYLEVM